MLVAAGSIRAWKGVFRSQSDQVPIRHCFQVHSTGGISKPTWALPLGLVDMYATVRWILDRLWRYVPRKRRCTNYATSPRRAAPDSSDYGLRTKRHPGANQQCVIAPLLVVLLTIVKGVAEGDRASVLIESGQDPAGCGLSPLDLQGADGSRRNSGFKSSSPTRLWSYCPGWEFSSEKRSTSNRRPPPNVAPKFPVPASPESPPLLALRRGWEKCTICLIPG